MGKRESVKWMGKRESVRNGEGEREVDGEERAEMDEEGGV